MSEILIMDLSQLDPSEVEYEVRIRSHYEPPPNARMLTDLGRATYWLAEDRANQVKPEALLHGLAEDQIAIELETCRGHILTIHDTVMEQVVLTGSFDQLPEATKLTSQLLHYHWRLMRLAPAELTQEQGEQREERLKQSRVAQTMLAAVIMANFRPETAANTTETGTNTMPSQPRQPPADRPNAENQADATHGSRQSGMAEPPHANSTLNGDGADEHNQTPFNVQADVQHRIELEAARRAEEYRICRERVTELHEDIHNEYCRPTSLKRPEEANRYMTRLTGFDSVMRNIFRLTTDVEMRTRIEQDINLLVADKYILEANLLRVPLSYPSPLGNPTTRAHSTIRPPNIYPTINLYDREIDGMTFNASHPYGLGDGQTNRNANGARVDVRNMTVNQQQPSNHVNFGENPATFIHSGRGHEASASSNPQNGSTRGQPVSHPYEGQQNSSHELPPPTRDAANSNAGTTTAGNRIQFNRVYHPAISTVRYPTYALEDRDLNDSRTAAEQQIDRLPSMNACQGQQYLARVLGNRRYDGKQSDGNKSISLDEFIGHARAYQRSTRSAEAVVLSQLATFFSGQAFIWWLTNGHTIHTLEELEVRLKSRFERSAMDPMSLLGEFCSRKQQRNEDLLDYVDDMRKKAAQCWPALEEPQIIARVVDNANEKYRALLAAKSYESVEALSRFAEYLVRDERPMMATDLKQLPRKPFARNRSVLAVETEAESAHNESEAADEEPQAENSAAAVVEALARVFTNWNGRRANNNDRGQSKPPLAQTQNEQRQQQQLQPQQPQRPQQQSTSVACWGCGAPGVYLANCIKCQQQLSSTKPKNEEATS